MRNISLLPINNALAQTLEDGEFLLSFGLQLGNYEVLVREVVGQALQMIAAVPREPPWGGYLTVDADAAMIVGTCGFKTGPSNGTVELAYFTFPEFEGQGFATAMADQMIALALASSSVRHIVAHTLPEPNASGRVLTKVGMQWMGEFHDPEDGRVWRWEYQPAKDQPFS